jgi:hypothetical protein
MAAGQGTAGYVAGGSDFEQRSAMASAGDPLTIQMLDAYEQQEQVSVGRRRHRRMGPRGSRRQVDS